MTSDTLLSSSDTAAAITANEVPVISPDQQFLQLQIEVETPLLLSVLNLVEILTIPVSQIVPVFQLPAWVIGVYNWRGDILWIVDLSHLLGFSPWYQQKSTASKHTVVILKGQSKEAPSGSEGPVLGLVVNRVNNMVVCEPELIQPIGDLEVPGAIKPFLRGYRITENGEPDWILKGDAVLSACSVSP